jgi:hypothetical protein
VHVRTHFKAVTPTPEIVSEVKKYAEAGSKLFERGNLRPADEEWWTNTTSEIVRLLERQISCNALTDEEIISCIPEEAYKGCWSDQERERVQQNHLQGARKGGAWVLPLGFMLRDAERLQMDALLRGQAIIEARTQLRAFVVAIAVVLGCVSLVPESD